MVVQERAPDGWPLTMGYRTDLALKRPEFRIPRATRNDGLARMVAEAVYSARRRLVGHLPLVGQKAGRARPSEAPPERPTPDRRILTVGTWACWPFVPSDIQDLSPRGRSPPWATIAGTSKAYWPTNWICSDRTGDKLAPSAADTGSPSRRSASSASAM